MLTAIRRTASHLIKMIATVGDVPYSGLLFENGSLIGEITLFIHLIFLLVTLANIMNRSHNEEWIDCVRTVTDFIFRLYSPYVQLVKMCQRCDW